MLDRYHMLEGVLVSLARLLIHVNSSMFRSTPLAITLKVTSSP